MFHVGMLKDVCQGSDFSIFSKKSYNFEAVHFAERILSCLGRCCPAITPH